MDHSLAARALAASTEITTAAVSGDDPDAMLPLVVRQAAGLVEADLGLVMVRSDDATLTVEAAHQGSEQARQAADPVGEVLSARSVAARAARSGVSIVVDDMTADPSTAPFVPAVLRGYGPFAVAPFGTRERRLGALAVYRVRGAEPFSRLDLDVLTTFAQQAGLALVLAEGATARRRVAVYEERERIAQDLHDVIVQRLYAAGMGLDLLVRRLAGRLDGADARRLAEAVEQVDETIAEVRATVRALRGSDPSEEASVGLTESIRAEVAIAAELLGREPRLELRGPLDEISPDLADQARAALREALSNVVRHSGARRVEVRVRHRDDRLRVQVIDDGCGIPKDVTRRGLRHLESRAASAGGRCVIESSTRHGTTVTWDVPVIRQVSGSA